MATTLTRVQVVLLLASCSVLAQPLTVCEVLSDLSGLNGKQVRIRGVWSVGDAMSGLLAVPPCERPTVHDGWEFVDGISVSHKLGLRNLASAYAEYSALARAHPRAKILVTLTGRLDAPEHFVTWTDPWGVVRPRAFWSFPANLTFWNAGDLRAVTLTADEIEALTRELQHPDPRRVH